MLRAIFVTLLFIVGWVMAFVGPLYALSLYLWIAYFRPEQWVFTDFFQRLSLSYYAGVFLLLRSVFSSEVRWRFDFRTALLLAFLLHDLVSTSMAPNTDYSFAYFRDFAKTIIIAYLISVMASDLKRLRLIVIVMTLSVSFEGAKQGWAQLLLNPTGVNANEVPMFGDNNGVAVGMLMVVSLLMALARTSPRPAVKLFFRFIGIGVLYRAVSTYSRGGFLTMGVLALVWIIRSKRKLVTGVGIALVAVVVFSALPAEYWERMDSITVEENEVRDASAEGRLHFWRVAWVMSAANPIFGVGHNGFNMSYDRFDSSRGAFGRRRSVHSAWLGVLAELGWPGLLMFTTTIAMGFMSCRRVRRLAKRGEISGELGDYAIGIEAALIAFCVGGAFVIFQYTEILWHTIGLSIAINHMANAELAVRAQSSAAAPLPELKPQRAS